MTQSPSIGRIVHFSQADDEAPHHNGVRVHPAMITRVWSDTCVNLKVFFDNGPAENRWSVCLRQDAAEHNPGSYWEWPTRA